MAKENIRGDRDELYGLHKQEQEEIMPLITAKPSEDFSDNPDAQSFWSTGRGCPRCSGRLAMYEMNTDTEVLKVYCKDCGRQWYHTDLDTDAIYRQIPQDMKDRYMAMFEKRNGGK